MFAAKHYPEYISPEELDAYLAKGWYRMGQTIFTTHYLCFGKTFYSALWIRLDLENYSFRKSLRKILRQNDQKFRTVFRPTRITQEKEILYQKYRDNFPGIIAPSLKDSLQDGEDFNIFNTYEFAAYDGDQLVALSFFDLGRKSAASILGIYDPEYRRHSLGFYTMLKEMEFCMECQFKYYYPGYVVPGYDRFDYKARIGEVDYYDLRQAEWIPYKGINPDDIPIHKMRQKLELLQQTVQQQERSAMLQFYPLFEANLFGFWRIPFFDYPVMLRFNDRPDAEGHYICIFDPRTNLYKLLYCTPFDDIQFYFNEAYTNPFKDDIYFLDLIMIDSVIQSSADPKAIISALNVEWNS